MKTRTLLAIATLALLTIILSGCGGHRVASFNPNTANGMVHSDSNWSLLEPSIGPTEMANAYAISELAKANAYAITKEADARAEMLKNISKGQPAGSQILGVIINEDPRKTARVNHPELSMVMVIKPGDHEFFQVSQIPNEVSVLFEGESQIKRLKIYKVNKTYDGAPIAFGARIYD